jgi:hypothetical protein
MARDLMSMNKLFLLDMGSEEFGDSILCQFGSKTIHFDGGAAGAALNNQSIVLK